MPTHCHNGPMPRTETHHFGSEKTIGRFSGSKTAHSILTAAAEILWPTRCAVCDAPGSLICGDCRKSLIPYDPWLSCPYCGAPFGKLQCCECNSFTTQSKGEPLTDDSCRSAFLFTEESGRIIKTFKDRDEQRLKTFIAQSMAAMLSPEEQETLGAIIPIPATKQAYIRRGYDHMDLVVQELSELTGIPVMHAFIPPKSLDQRSLNRNERLQNMRSAFSLTLEAQERLPERLLVVDDVLTTGSTIKAAQDVLLESGAKSVLGLTFARVL